MGNMSAAASPEVLSYLKLAKASLNSFVAQTQAVGEMLKADVERKLGAAWNGNITNNIAQVCSLACHTGRRP